MSGTDNSDNLEHIWNSISEAFDRDEEADISDLPGVKGFSFESVPEDVSAAAAEVLRAAFDEEPPPDLKNSKYVIRERLITGGQSDIYLADRSDGVYQQTVVIKLMSHRMGKNVARDHLRQEMQLLADLNHPGIVQIIDGGLTAKGRPWLVLEYIQGSHLNDYCKSHQLSEKAVMEIFVNLCDALRFIHLRGVVHMDLKAGNVLVREINGVAWPVIIDLGIALEAAAYGSAERQVIFGTKGYSAPEQLQGNSVDQRADIYSTGMMLAQVLTADKKANIGLLPTRERESLLRKCGVSPDIIQIIRQCTHEDPADRYASVEALRTDLNNWLNDFPLIANRSRPLHVLGLTIRRHKLVSAATLAVLLAAIGFTYRYASDITELQDMTSAERNASDALFNYMQTDLFEELTRIGRVDMLRMTAERSLAHLENLDPRTLDGASRLQSAIAYINAGKVFDVLESSARALEAYAQAEQQLALIENEPDLRREYLRQLATVNLYKSLTSTTELQESVTLASLEHSVDLSTTLISEYPDEEPDVLWEAHLQLGWHYMEYDQPEQAREHIDAALAIARNQAPRFEGTPRFYRWLLSQAQSQQALAWFAFDYGESVESVEAINQAVALARMTLSEDDQDIEFLDNYRILLNQQSFFFIEAGQVRSAEESNEESIRVGRQLKIMAPRSLKYERELAYSYTTGAELAQRRGDFESALAYYRQSLNISRSIARTNPGDFSSSNDLAIDLTGTANALKELGYMEEARANWAEAVSIMAPIRASEPDNKYYTFSLAVPLIQLERYDEARPLVEALRSSGMEDDAFMKLLAEHNLK